MPTENASRFEHIPLVRSIAATLSLTNPFILNPRGPTHKSPPGSVHFSMPAVPPLCPWTLACLSVCLPTDVVVTKAVASVIHLRMYTL